MSESASADRVRVALWPRWPDNPYLADLRRGLKDAGADTCDASVRTLWSGADVFHLQWPDAIWSGGRRGRVARLVEVAAMLAVAGVRRVAVVVTVHNLSNHESSGGFARRVVATVLRRASRIVVLSESGRERFIESVGVDLDPDVVEVIAHMDWADRYPPISVEHAREVLTELPTADGPLIGWFGLIRPYKGVDRLIEVVETDTGRPPLRLVLLGRRHDQSADSDQVQVVAGSDRIVHVDRHVTDREISALCALADWAVFPFERVENSGSVIAALAAGATVVAPRIGALADLEPNPGLHLYEGEFTRSTLDGIEALDLLSPEATEDRSVAEVSRRHLGLYRAVTERNRARTPR